MLNKVLKKKLTNVATYLEAAMENDTKFASEIETIAREINAGKIQDNSNMTQNVYDQGTGIQNKGKGESTQYIAKEMYFNSKKDKDT